MSNKSDVVSGMGVGMSIIQTLVTRVKKAGGTDEDIHRLATPEADATWEKIITVIIGVFTMLVDYGRSLKDSILAGKYDWVNNNITEEHFPATEGEQGKKGQSFRLYHFGETTESEENIKKMDKDGYRPATAREIIAFGEKYPELQRQFPIIALGSVWADAGGSRGVVGLCGGSGRRSLRLDYFARGWDDSYRFLAVRK